MSSPQRAPTGQPEAVDLLGCIVASRAGRDAGSRYVVIAALGPDAVLVADGRRRPVDRPKRKNVKHLVLESAADGALRQRLQSGEAVRDDDVRAVLGAGAGEPPQGE